MLTTEREWSAISLVTGAAKTVLFETAARITAGVFGTPTTVAQSGQTVITALASRSAQTRIADALDAVGGRVVSQAGPFGSASRPKFRTTYRLYDQATINWSNFFQGRDAVALRGNSMALDDLITRARVPTYPNGWQAELSLTNPRFSTLGDVRVGFVTDAALGFLFQAFIDTNDPFLTSQQRLLRGVISGGGGATASLGLGAFLGGAGTFLCGPGLPACAIGGTIISSVGGAVGWSYIQPILFERFGLVPSRSLGKIN